jgi:sugar phosphate isomerase/epimerase
MQALVNRRKFLVVGGALTTGIGLANLVSRASASPVASATPHAEKLGWRLGCQAYSFNHFTFFEAIDKNASLGLKVIEAYPGQKLSAGLGAAAINETLAPDLRKQVKQKLADSGVTLVNYGVCGLENQEAQCRKVFDFAKDMGIETLVAEPPPEAFDLLDKLCEEYRINVALHNHPEPSRYWNPDTVLSVCEGRSKRIGACADTGHWMRSGIHPLDALKKLQGRIISFHFKDLNKFGRKDAHDVPWGTGAGDVKDVLKEVQRQGVKAVFSIEYEYNWLDSVPEIAQCVEFFDQTAAALATS